MLNRLTPCSVENCEKRAKKRGFCEAHYRKFLKWGDPTAGYSQGAAAAWIEANASFNGDECLQWPFGMMARSVGTCVFRGRKMLGTRAMCEAAHGPAPTPKHEAAHNCGKGHLGCCNPKHLRWATHYDNHQDRWEHGTQLLGEKAPAAKLTREKVHKIRRLADNGKSYEMLADLFDVSSAEIGRIAKRKRWGWLPEERPACL